MGVHRIYSRRMLQLQAPSLYVHSGSVGAHQSSLIVMRISISIIIIIIIIITSSIVVITRARFQ